MLGIGFNEILIIGTVGLIVIGPKRLPETARFLGHLIARMQRQVAGVKADIRREMELEDIKNIRREYENAATKMQGVFNQTAKDAPKAAKDAQTAAVAGAPAAAKEDGNA